MKQVWYGYLINFLALVLGILYFATKKQNVRPRKRS